jgi:hypothetical protein
MDYLADAVSEFLRFGLRNDSFVAYPVFAGASGIIGLAIVLLDLCAVELGTPSVLGLTHGRHATARAAFYWAAGAIIAASLGLVVHVFEPTPLGAVAASLTWKTLLERLKDLTKAGNRQGLPDE